MSSNDTRNDRPPPWGHEGDKEAIGFGRWLRRQREIREVPLREIADVTKISLRYLEALEQERFDVLPAPVFARGFLREYSRYVGLDADEVVNSFLIATGEVIEGADEEDDGAGDSKGERSRTKILIGASILAILAIVIAVAVLYRMRAERPIQSSPIAAPVLPMEVATAEVEVAPPPAEGSSEGSMPVESPSSLVVTIDFTEDCWMEAVVDNERTISELRVQGESMRLEAEELVSLTLGNPSGVRVEVNGHPYDFSYSQGRIIRSLEIDGDLARALAGEES